MLVTIQRGPRSSRSSICRACPTTTAGPCAALFTSKQSGFVSCLATTCRYNTSGDETTYQQCKPTTSATSDDSDWQAPLRSWGRGSTTARSSSQCSCKLQRQGLSCRGRHCNTRASGVQRYPSCSPCSTGVSEERGHSSSGGGGGWGRGSQRCCKCCCSSSVGCCQVSCVLRYRG